MALSLRVGGRLVGSEAVVPWLSSAALRLPFGGTLVALQLPFVGPLAALRLPFGCPSVALRLLFGCPSTTLRLLSFRFPSAAHQPPFGCSSAAPRGSQDQRPGQVGQPGHLRFVFGPSTVKVDEHNTVNQRNSYSTQQQQQQRGSARLGVARVVAAGLTCPDRSR